MKRHELINKISFPAIMGLVGTGFIELGTRLDAFLNLQIIESLRSNTYWWQYLTSKHALTPLYLDNEPTSAIITFLALTGLSYLITKR